MKPGLHEPPSAPSPIRRTYLIHRRFQLRVVLAVNLLSLSALGAAAIALDQFVSKSRTYAVKSGLPLDHPMATYLADRERGLFALMAFLALAFVLVSSIAALILSNRVAGPLYRLRKHLDAIADGKLPAPLKFRPNDEFPELAETCNRAVATLRHESERKKGA